VIADFGNPSADANSATNAALALPRSAALQMRTFKCWSCQPLIALFAAPAATLIAMRVIGVVAVGLAMALACTNNNLVELIGESLAVTVIERRLATGIDSAAAQ